MGKCRHLKLPFVANSTPNVVTVQQGVVCKRLEAGELSR